MDWFRSRHIKWCNTYFIWYSNANKRSGIGAKTKVRKKWKKKIHVFSRFSFLPDDNLF